MIDYATVVAMDSKAILLDMYGREGAVKGPIAPNNLGEKGFMDLVQARVAQDAGLVAVVCDRTMEQLELGADGRLLGRYPPGIRPFPAGPVSLTVSGVGTSSARIESEGNDATVDGTIEIAVEVHSNEAIINIPIVPFSTGQSAGLIAKNVADALRGRQSASGRKLIHAVATGASVLIQEDRGAKITALTATLIPA